MRVREWLIFFAFQSLLNSTWKLIKIMIGIRNKLTLYLKLFKIIWNLSLPLQLPSKNYWLLQLVFLQIHSNQPNIFSCVLNFTKKYRKLTQEPYNKRRRKTKNSKLRRVCIRGTYKRFLNYIFGFILPN